MCLKIYAGNLAIVPPPPLSPSEDVAHDPGKHHAHPQQQHHAHPQQQQHHTHSLPGGSKEVAALAAVATSRGIPIVSAPPQHHAPPQPQQSHHRTVAIPVNLIGGAPQEVNLRLAPASRGGPPGAHAEILIKSERT